MKERLDVQEIDNLWIRHDGKIVTIKDYINIVVDEKLAAKKHKFKRDFSKKSISDFFDGCYYYKKIIYKALELNNIYYVEDISYIRFLSKRDFLLVRGFGQSAMEAMINWFESKNVNEKYYSHLK